MARLLGVCRTLVGALPGSWLMGVRGGAGGEGVRGGTLGGDLLGVGDSGVGDCEVESGRKKAVMEVLLGGACLVVSLVGELWSR